MESIFLGTDQVSRASIHTERLISEVVARRHSTRLPWSQKWRRFDCIANTERSLQPTTSAISAGGRLLRIISRICACCDSARFGAILGSDCCQLEHLQSNYFYRKDKLYDAGVRAYLADVRVFGLVEVQKISPFQIKKCINRPLQCYYMLTFLQNEFH